MRDFWWRSGGEEGRDNGVAACSVSAAGLRVRAMRNSRRYGVAHRLQTRLDEHQSSVLIIARHMGRSKFWNFCGHKHGSGKINLINHAK